MSNSTEFLNGAGELAEYLGWYRGDGKPDRYRVYMLGYRGDGPPTIRVGGGKRGRLMWRVRDVEAWLDAHTVPLGKA